jgi:hypothetical protein
MQMSSHISHSLARERQRDLLRAAAEQQTAEQPSEKAAERQAACKERTSQSLRGRLMPRISR